ncbi:MAG: hypothetical protein K2G34_08455, partial [Bacteroides sp.]|nr:hypothetical protein [Bacteroides sp.]
RFSMTKLRSGMTKLRFSDTNVNFSHPKFPDILIPPTDYSCFARVTIKLRKGSILNAALLKLEYYTHETQIYHFFCSKGIE